MEMKAETIKSKGDPIEKEAATEEVKDDISEYDQEQLADFRNEIKTLKATEGGPVQEIDPDLLGNDEHRLWKFFKKYKGEGWPKLRVSMFEGKLNEYEAQVLTPLTGEKGHNDPEVKSKDKFVVHLRAVVSAQSTKAEG